MTQVQEAKVQELIGKGWVRIAVDPLKPGSPTPMISSDGQAYLVTSSGEVIKQQSAGG